MSKKEPELDSLSKGPLIAGTPEAALTLFYWRLNQEQLSEPHVKEVTDRVKSSVIAALASSNKNKK